MGVRIKILSIIVLFLLAVPTANAAEQSEHRPVISPDGKAMIYMSMSDETAGDWELFHMTADGMNLQRLTKRPGWDGYAVWAPHGLGFAFDRGDPNDPSNKYPAYMDMETGQTRKIGDFQGWLSVNDWHGDDLLVFWERDGQRDLYLMTEDGTITEQLTATIGKSEHDAHFSPDGASIAFATQAASGDGQTHLEILDRVTHKRTVLRTSNGRIYGIDWSPDGRLIAFTDAPEGDEDDADVFVYELATQEIKRCTSSDSWDHMPVWIDGGQNIIFTSYRSGKEHMYTTNCSTGAGTSALRLWSGDNK